jgi:hypothetical protein
VISHGFWSPVVRTFIVKGSDCRASRETERRRIGRSVEVFMTREYIAARI